MLVVTAVCFLLWIYDVGDMWHCMVLAIFGNEIVQRSHRPRFETVSKNRATTRRLGCAGWRIVWCPAPKDLDKLLAPDDIAAIFTDPELELRDFVYWSTGQASRAKTMGTAIAAMATMMAPWEEGISRWR